MVIRIVNFHFVRLLGNLQTSPENQAWLYNLKTSEETRITYHSESACAEA